MCGAELSARINTAVRAARPFAVEQCARAWCNRIRVRITWSTAPDLPSSSIALPLVVVSVHAARGEFLTLLDVRPHQRFVALESALDSRVVRDGRCVIGGCGELARQDVRAHQGQARAEAGQRGGTVAGITE
jgi:hypothetical protein